MPQEVQKSKKPSGFQQRKVRKVREEALKEYERSMLPFVKLRGKSQQPNHKGGIFDSDSTLDVRQVQVPGP